VLALLLEAAADVSRGPRVPLGATTALAAAAAPLLSELPDEPPVPVSAPEDVPPGAKRCSSFSNSRFRWFIARPFDGARRDYDPLLDLIGDARIVVLGAQTHKELLQQDGPGAEEALFSAEQNALLVANAERARRNPSLIPESYGSQQARNGEVSPIEAKHRDSVATNVN